MSRNFLTGLLSLFSALLALTPGPTLGAGLSDVGYLRKLSLHLRGHQPAAEEYMSLINASNKESFLSHKIDEYLASPKYQERMTFILSKKFAMQTPSISLLDDKDLSKPESKARQDAMVNLFRAMARENLSWDTLLVGKKYDLVRSQEIANFSKLTNDFDFFGMVKSDLPYVSALPAQANWSDPKAHTEVSFAADDLRVAGALTTARFTGHYKNSVINKNRQRAAAVYKTFLCDPMSLSFGAAADPKKARLEAVFGAERSTGPETADSRLRKELHGSSMESQHGKLPQCAQCHYKLDPLGQTFEGLTAILTPDPAPGRLRFTRANGEKVDIEVQGIGELAQKITEQPEYVACQVDQLWREFIGRDVPLSSSRKQELAAAFDSPAIQRRTNDLVRLFVTSPEYRNPQTQPKSAFITYSQVQPLLKRCDSCHGGDPTNDAPPFSNGLPFIVDGQNQTADWLKAMDGHVNCPTSMDDRMPRDANQWDPNDLEKVRTWLATGARDDQGQPQLTQRIQRCQEKKP